MADVTDALLGLAQGFVQGGGIQNIGGIIAGNRAQEAMQQALAPTPQGQGVAQSGIGGFQQMQQDAQRKMLQLTQRAIKIAGIPGGQNAARTLLSVSPMISQNVNQLTTQTQAILNRAAQIKSQQGEDNARRFLSAAMESNALSPQVKALLPRTDDPNFGASIDAMQAAVQTTNDLSKQVIKDQFSPVKVQQFGTQDILTRGSQPIETAPAQSLLLEKEAARRKGIAQRVITDAGISSSTEFQKEAAKVLGKRTATKIADIQDAAFNANVDNAKIDSLEKLLPSATLGPGANMRNFMQRIVSSVGGKRFDESISSTEAFRALGNELVLEKVKQLPGALSEKELKFLSDATVNIEQTPEGIKKILDFRRRLNDRAIQLDKFLSGRDKIDKETRQQIREFIENNPIFDTGTEKGMQTNAQSIPRPKTQEEFDSLPSGALYEDVDTGQVFRK